MMIKKSSILYAITKPLSINFPNIPIYSLDNVETVETDAFYVNIITVSRDTEMENYITKRFTVDIMYKKKVNNSRQIYMDIEDEILDEIFTNYLTIKSLDDDIKDLKPHIFSQGSNITDNVLHCMFDIEFIDKIEIIGTESMMGDLRLEFDLVNEVINPIM